MENKSPFKFLDAYQKDDISVFFGRKTETKTLFEKTFESNLILLYGLSGTGKTSLVNCGLHNMFADTDWLPLLIRRQEDINESLRQAIYRAAKKKKALENKTISKMVYSLYLDHYKPVYLIFDQFEELFILGEPTEAGDFFWNLLEILEAKTQAKIILIMREEYLANLDRYEKIIPTLFDNRLRLERMRTEEIADVVRLSAEAHKIEIEEPKEDRISEILENIKHPKGWIDLANLQIYLDRLYRDDVDKRGEDAYRLFDNELIKTTGHLDNVLSRLLDEQLQKIDEEVKEKSTNAVENFSLKVLAQMITNEGTKQPLGIEAVIKGLVKNKKMSREDIIFCLERLKDLRIIRYMEQA